MWKFIVDVVHDFVSSLQPDVGRGFLHVSNVFLLLNVLLCWKIFQCADVRNGLWYRYVYDSWAKVIELGFEGIDYS